MKNVRIKLASAVAAVTAVLFGFAGTALAAIGDGTADDVSGDDISEVKLIVQDNVLEHLPAAILLFSFLLGVSIALLLIVGISMRVRSRIVRTAKAGA